MKTVQLTPEMQKFQQAVKNCMRENIGNLSAMELLAIQAYILGQTLALQDRRLSKDVYLDLIVKNIEQGNYDTINDLLGTTKGSA